MHHGHLTHRLGLLKGSILRLWHRLLHNRRQVDVVYLPPLFPQTCHLCAHACACFRELYIYMPVTINFKCPSSRYHFIGQPCSLLPYIRPACPPPPSRLRRASEHPNKTNENMISGPLPFSILGEWNEIRISAVASCL